MEKGKGKGASLLLLLLLVHMASSALIYYPQLPVKRRTLYKAQVALNRWERELDYTYGSSYENPRRIKRKTDMVVGQLRQMSRELSGYENVLLGGGNGLLGSKNIIIGNNNAVYGNNNYIFSEGFSYTDVKGGQPTSAINNYLVNDNWVAELDKREQIPYRLHEVIYPYK